MKYIRTKDRLFQIESISEPTYITGRGEMVAFSYCDKYNDRRVGECLSKDVKQADTIEELCDEYVVELGNGTHRFVGSLSGKGKGGITWYRQRNYKIVAIYGAIWTNKGLIYVAKMNSKGELKLL